MTDLDRISSRHLEDFINPDIVDRLATLESA
jgi:hypothetical protein